MGDTDQGGPVTDERVNVARIIEGHDGARAALISRNQTITYDELADQSQPPARRPGAPRRRPTATVSP